MKKEPLNLFDVVALLKDMPEKGLVFGQVGTVVEVLADNVFEIEFANKQGETIAAVAVKGEHLMLLHYDAVTAK